jgi:hypothetical protein
MKVLTMLFLAGLLGLSSAAASADTAAAGKPAATKTQGTITSAAPEKVSQQDKMRACSKQATGKKGAERKAFMKTCLSAKKA